MYTIDLATTVLSRIRRSPGGVTGQPVHITGAPLLTRRAAGLAGGQHTDPTLG